MTAARTTAPYRSGFCAAGRHDRCRRDYRTAVCDCPHHDEPPLVTVHCALGCRGHVETGTDPRAAHEAMERHYATVHAEPVPLHHCSTCRCVGVASPS